MNGEKTKAKFWESSWLEGRVHKDITPFKKILQERWHCGQGFKRILDKGNILIANDRYIRVKVNSC